MAWGQTTYQNPWTQQPPAQSQQTYSPPAPAGGSVAGFSAAKAPTGWGSGAPRDTGAQRPVSDPNTAGAGNLTGGDWTPQNTPGAAENYWGQYGSQFNQPGASQNYWNGVQGFFAPGPSGAESAMSGYASQLGGHAGAAEGLYGQYQGSGIFTNPGQYENWFAQNGNALAGGGQGGAALQALLPQYQQSGAGEDYYNRTQGFYGQAGAMEQLYGAHGQDLQGPGMLAQREGGITNQIGQAVGLQGYLGSQNLTGPSWAEQYASQYGPQGVTGSYAEDFLNGGKAGSGLDDLYNRLTSTSARQLDDRAAAGGSFNSGASLRAQEEMRADMNAQHVRDYAAAVNAADAAKMARLGFNESMFQGADQDWMNRINTGIQGYNAADQTSLGRARALFDVGQGLSQEKLNNFNASFNAAQGTQAASLARVMGGQQAADSAFQERLGRLNGQQSTANMLNQNDINRFNATQSAAQAAQAAAMNRVSTGMGAANTAQSLEDQRIAQAAQLEQQQQQMALQRMLGGGQLSTSASNDELTRLTGGMNAANLAQNAQQGRQNDTFNNLQALANAQAGAYAGQTAAANAEQLQTVMSQIQGLLGKGALTAAEQTQLNMLMQQYQQMAIAGGTNIGKK